MEEGGAAPPPSPPLLHPRGEVAQLQAMLAKERAYSQRLRDGPSCRTTASCSLRRALLTATAQYRVTHSIAAVRALLKERPAMNSHGRRKGV